MSHTKGPWRVGEITSSQLDDKGAQVQVLGPRGTVCVTDESSANEALDNARLIAAAPELLDALKELQASGMFETDEQRNGKEPDFSRYWYGVSRAILAIAKADGTE